MFLRFQALASRLWTLIGSGLCGTSLGGSQATALAELVAQAMAGVLAYLSLPRSLKRTSAASRRIPPHSSLISPPSERGGRFCLEGWAWSGGLALPPEGRAGAGEACGPMGGEGAIGGGTGRAARRISSEFGSSTLAVWKEPLQSMLSGLSFQQGLLRAAKAVSAQDPGAPLGPVFTGCPQGGSRRSRHVGELNCLGGNPHNWTKRREIDRGTSISSDP